MISIWYRSSIAATTATRIGVLEYRRTNRQQCGIFSSTAWRSFSGGPCGRVARLAGSCIRYANPARSAHPDWRRGWRNQKPQYRSLAMKTTTNIQVTETSSVRVVVSETTPPWFGFSSLWCQTIKVGNLFVTVEVKK